MFNNVVEIIIKKEFEENVCINSSIVKVFHDNLFKAQKYCRNQIQKILNKLNENDEKAINIGWGDADFNYVYTYALYGIGEPDDRVEYHIKTFDISD